MTTSEGVNLVSVEFLTHSLFLVWILLIEILIHEAMTMALTVLEFSICDGSIVINLDSNTYCFVILELTV